MKIVDFKLTRDCFNRLVLTDEQGSIYEDVIPVRAFPITAAQFGLSLMDRDGHEIVWIDRLDALAPEIVTLILEALSKREFVPEINAIRGVSSFSCPSTWQIDTDRGSTEIVLKGEEDIRRLSSDSLLIADTHGIQYLIRKLSELDRSSKKIIDRFL